MSCFGTGKVKKFKETLFFDFAFHPYEVMVVDTQSHVVTQSCN